MASSNLASCSHNLFPLHIIRGGIQQFTFRFKHDCLRSAHMGVRIIHSVKKETHLDT